MEFEARLAAVPRLRLDRYPSPLEPLPRLTRLLGGPQLWVKRDDVIGPGMGGNKTRKLEFLFGEALERGAKVVATFGGLQSNFARQMCAIARAQNLQPHCFYFGPRPVRLEGNLLLAHLLGARLHFVPFGSGGDGGMTIEQATSVVHFLVRCTPGCAGRGTYFMPVGGHIATGALGYVLAAQELEAQLAERGIMSATVVTAAGTGGTLAGLMAGFCLLGSRHTPLGIDVGKLWRAFPASIAHVAGEICQNLGQSRTFGPTDVPLIEQRYVGEAYAALTPAAVEAIRLVAAQEGLLLDPVYTSKAMSGLLDLARGSQPRWAATDHVVFLHTGGLPALWVYEDALVAARV